MVYKCFFSLEIECFKFSACAIFIIDLPLRSKRLRDAKNKLKFVIATVMAFSDGRYCTV